MPHKAECVRQLRRRCEWEELEHPPYSPDILPCGFDLIPKVKDPICGARYLLKFFYAALHLVLNVVLRR
ncbi:hypothetical protein TNCV_289851 [Trichonephila clavipes]|nr:hypothetical protein TNCV_289851 [Trichonephila clavipes]